jgi:hypothetical protein
MGVNADRASARNRPRCDKADLKVRLYDVDSYDVDSRERYTW